MKSLEKVNTTKLTAYQLFQKGKLKESWTIISEKEDLNWTTDFIETNKANLDWKALSFNDSLQWSINFIKQFEDLWNWHALSFIIADKNHFERADFDLLLKRYMDKLDWRIICQGTNLNNNHLIDYADFIHWDTLSSNSRFTWSDTFVNEYIDKINWKVFTECLATVKTPSVVQNVFRNKVLDLYANKLDFGILSANDSLDFTPDIIEKYKKRWNWAELINNPAIEWDEAMLKKYDKYISQITPEELKVSFLWTSLIENDAQIEMLLAYL
ncbi:MAG: hypothetical protein WCL70_11130 [Paludibacter sp.]